MTEEKLDAAKARVFKYLDAIGKIQTNESVEGGSNLGQLINFMDYLIKNPEKKTVLEIGFNTGLSAVSFLAARSDVSVISVDIGVHAYVQQCALVPWSASAYYR